MTGDMKDATRKAPAYCFNGMRIFNQAAQSGASDLSGLSLRFYADASPSPPSKV